MLWDPRHIVSNRFDMACKNCAFWAKWSKLCTKGNIHYTAGGILVLFMQLPYHAKADAQDDQFWFQYL